jgi:hypothetical protein
MADEESEENIDVTNSATPQVNTQNGVPSKPQRGYSRTLTFKPQGRYFSLNAQFMKNTSVVGTEEVKIVK